MTTRRVEANKLVKYDDASWHYGGDYPKELPIENAFTHTGIFLAWSILNELASEEMLDDFSDEIKQLKAKAITGGELFQIMDGKLSDGDLSSHGKQFADLYYTSDSGFGYNYYDDYGRVVETVQTRKRKEYQTLYHFEDTWENYALVAKIISKRYKCFLDLVGE